jgi:hypothetical protein
MRPALINITILLAAILILPLSAQGSWWGGGADRDELDLDSGYDVNTVTTVRGRITALSLDGPQPQAQVELAAGAGSVTVVLGPRSYWSEHGIALRLDDQVTVRGSKAQGRGGVVYLLAQRLSVESRGQEIALRNESGRPVWAAAGRRTGPHANRPSPSRPSPGRIGGGRMGR